ncbi:MAG: AAA family ATPase, partial [Succinatimonas hippei]|nr:AAA family ATPase [Succinatimonas hippei]
MKSAKQVSAGSEKFSDFIDGNAYYVDKTLFLRPIFASEDNIDKIKVFTRPRRFGKTLTMNMFKEFLSINPDNPGDTGRQERLFKGLDVMKDTEFVNKYMGQYPVVSMTLKRVYGKTFDDAVRMLAAVISETAAKFEYLKQSPKLNDYEKSQLELYIKHGRLLESENRYNIQLFLNFICNALYKHFSRPVVLLIDEYDVPLAKAQSRGYHSDMVDFYSQFLDILKTSGDAVYKIVMTGCLKVAKNSIFTGANNFTANTVLTKNPVF